MKSLIDMKPVLFLIMLFCFTSCVKDIDLEYLRPDPKLVVNCLATVGDTVKATVSRTWFFTDKRPNNGIKEAEVKLYVNDAFREQMQWREETINYQNRGYFISSYIPVSGDRIRIEASAPDMNPVSANTSVPVSSPLVNFKYENTSDTLNNMVTVKNRYLITFRDDPSQKNYYLLRLDRGEPYQMGDSIYYEWYSASADYSTDPLFGSNTSVLDKILGYDWLSGYRGRVFTDELINGKEYTIRLESGSYSSYYPGYDYPGNGGPGYEEPGDEEKEKYPIYLRVGLYAISESYYYYMRALEMQSDDSLSNALIDGGLAEPVRVFSNIEGGVGILGSCCRDTMTVISGYYWY